ncbi:MAG: hypothetical protein C5B49_12980 [Bdellovibrio sp.]|nr:MAG: hypothetical protein C5B49_12980 [Bdellovibrio sp.]
MNREKLLTLGASAMGAVMSFLLLRLYSGALIFPFELEIREGVSWIFVLAQSEGLNLYDHSKLAYFNMCPGPFEPLAKFWLYQITPFFPSQVNTRLFILFSPLFSVGAIFLALRRREGRGLLLALLLALALILSVINLAPYAGLVGRSDALALALTVFLAGVTFHSIEKSSRGKPSRWSTPVAALLSALAFFANWRYAPAVGVLLGLPIVLDSRPASQPASEWLKSIFRLKLIVLVVWTTVFLLFLGLQFDFDIDKYYRHFFGFFFDEKSIHTTPIGEFELFPSEILNVSRGVPILFLMATMFVLVIQRIRQKTLNRRALILIPLIFLAYLVYSLGFYFNKSGGGLYYFAPFLVVSWGLFAWLLGRSSVPSLKLIMGVLLYLFIVPNWGQVFHQSDNLWKNMQPAIDFRAHLEQLDEQDGVLSEDLQLFKKKFRDSQVDNGDLVELLSQTGYFGDEFSQTAQRHFADVRNLKFKYVFTAGIASATLKQVLSSNYQPRFMAPPYETLNGPGGCVITINCPVLFELRR